MSTEKPTRAIAWKTIYTHLIDSGIFPVEVRLHPDDISATIQLQDGAFDDVAAALYDFGLPKGEVWAMRGQDPYLWFQGQAEEFYTWGRYCNHSVASPLLPGWNVSIYCQVRTADYPLQADADVLVAETVAALDEPKARVWRDAEGDIWTEQPWEGGSILAYTDAFGDVMRWTFEHVERECGPLVEVVPQPNAEAQPKRVRMGDACGPEHTYRDACQYTAEAKS